MESLAECRSRTNALIDAHRKTALSLTVKRKALWWTRPYSNVTVSLKPIHGSCLFGCNLGGFGSLPDFDTLFESLFDYATLGMFWKYCETSTGALDFSYTKAVAQWCKERNILVKGTAFVYALDSLRPKALLGKDLRALANWMPFVTAAATALKDSLQYADTVNEFVHEPVGDIRPAYAEVKRLAPAIQQLVNEYGALTGETAPFVDSIYAVSNTPGASILGVQAHVKSNEPFDYNYLREYVLRPRGMGDTQTHITEVSIPSAPETGRQTGSNFWTEALQAEHLERTYRECFANPTVSAITYWYLANGDPWRPSGGLCEWLPNGTYREKPAMAALRGLLAAWRPSYMSATDSQGKVSLPGLFKGTYDVFIGGKLRGRVDTKNGSTTIIC